MNDLSLSFVQILNLVFLRFVFRDKTSAAWQVCDYLCLKGGYELKILLTPKILVGTIFMQYKWLLVAQ
jgi:hypothetical protein